MKRSLLVAVVLPAVLAAQTRTNPLKYPAKPTVAAITPADLMSRLYVFADDSMNGRAAGTKYHDKGVEYIGRELARLGLKPGGVNGTFFQPIPLMVHNVVADLSISVDGRAFTQSDFLTRDAVDFGASARELNGATAVYGGMFPDTANMIKPTDVSGKVVVFTVPRGWQANRGGLVQRYIMAAGIVVATLDSMPPEVRQSLSTPSTYLNNGPQLLPVPMFFYSSRAMAEAMVGPLATAIVGAPGKAVTGSVKYTDTQAPGSRNVVAILPGSDKKLAGEYVAIGAHSDHVQPGSPGAGGDYNLPIDHDSIWAFYHVARPMGAEDDGKRATAEDWVKINAKIDSLRKVHAPRQDSVYNGADDDGTGSMGLLEIAEAFATSKTKPKRSILFIWHVGEELGLYGSEYFTDNPTVPRDSITTELNIDMIGRGSAQDLPNGGPGYLQMIGSRRLSTELGDLMEKEAAKLNPPFSVKNPDGTTSAFDYQFDTNGHPLQYYCRSDHYEYARYGIPIAFMSTGGHPDYHQVTDEPQYIDYDKFARVAQLVFNSAKDIANLDHRLVVDKPKPDPKGQCRQ
ncbi:MAG TPA: M28 family peptidase [Gemmatimonadaceae bacterium]